MDRPTPLPAGLTARPLTLDDAPAVLAAIEAEEVVDLGEAERTLEDVLADWQRPSNDITSSTIGVLDGDLLVGDGDVSGPDVGYAAVLPAYQARGARAHGAVRCYLSTGTRAGARGLYEKVGMVVASTRVNPTVELQP